MRFIQELRSSSGGSFGSMTLQDVVGGVTQLILDHQVTGFYQVQTFWLMGGGNMFGIDSLVILVTLAVVVSGQA